MDAVSLRAGGLYHEHRSKGPLSVSTVIQKPPFTESPVSVVLEEVVLVIFPKEAGTQVSGKPSPLFQDTLDWIQQSPLSHDISLFKVQ